MHWRWTTINGKEIIMATSAARYVGVPTLSPAIPARIVGGQGIKNSARVTLMLLDACAMLGIAVKHDETDALGAACAAINAWMAKQLGALEIFTPLFWLRPHHPQHYYYGSDVERIKAGVDAVDVIWQSRRIKPVTIGARLEYLEGVAHGLGVTVLHALAASRATFSIMTPDDVLDMASYLYWGGAEDETGYIEEIAEDDEDREQMLKDMVTKATIVAAFPPWVTAKGGKTLRDRALRELEKQTCDPFVRDVVATVRRIAKLKVERFPLDIEGEFIDFSAVACWREDDIVLRVADDLINMAQQSEYCEISGELTFAIDAPETLAAWLESMKTFFASAAAVDHLLWLVSKADYGRQEKLKNG
jgi:PRTRC genetic system protein F